MPGNAGTEQTTTVIIGTGLSGLAVAAELRRRGIDSIVVDGLDTFGATPPAVTTSLQRIDTADSATLQERNEILRHLRNYAASHDVDIRSTRALQLTQVDGAPESAASPQWQVHTPTGVLVADHIVLTRCAQSQLRRMLNDFGIAVGRNLAAAMRAIGIYLVGVGELITPSPKEVLRQAKTVGQAISAKVNPDSTAFPATGSLAMLPC
ncbi:FAD-dependent monooxygenase [Pseudarthrobacter equi]|uniref:FAD-dependent monooxygenase n=1 Tax=Pseudarthrobacter equi TaxID=728066 RepID=UPI0021C07397|nr:FAD-dependent monooxygenase [Pseudarthrobacter equi]MCT9625889.1 FAD-dependent monooxygenase [Pseudarthrobacter equi]